MRNKLRRWAIFGGIGIADDSYQDEYNSAETRSGGRRLPIVVPIESIIEECNLSPASVETRSPGWSTIGHGPNDHIVVRTSLQGSHGSQMLFGRWGHSENGTEHHQVRESPDVDVDTSQAEVEVSGIDNIDGRAHC